MVFMRRCRVKGCEDAWSMARKMQSKRIGWMRYNCEDRMDEI